MAGLPTVVGAVVDSTADGHMRLLSTVRTIREIRDDQNALWTRDSSAAAMIAI
jgi:hypothetical protein